MTITSVIIKFSNLEELQNFIKRTSYCGIICKKWTKYIPIKAKWEGIVSIDLWNRANRGKFFLEQDDKDKESLSPYGDC